MKHLAVIFFVLGGCLIATADVHELTYKDDDLHFLPPHKDSKEPVYEKVRHTSEKVTVHKPGDEQQHEQRQHDNHHQRHHESHQGYHHQKASKIKEHDNHDHEHQHYDEPQRNHHDDHHQNHHYHEHHAPQRQHDDEHHHKHQAPQRQYHHEHHEKHEAPQRQYHDEHHEKHQAPQRQYYEEGHHHQYDTKKQIRSPPKHNHYRTSKPRGLEDPPFVTVPHRQHYARDQPIARNLFSPANREQESDPVVYASAPNSVFHTQINVQSQGSEFYAPNASVQYNVPLGDGFEDEEERGLRNAGFNRRLNGDSVDRLNNRQLNQRRQGLTQDTGDFVPFRTADQNFDSRDVNGNQRQVLARTNVLPIGRTDEQPIRNSGFLRSDRPRANYQGVNVINGNIRSDRLPAVGPIPGNANSNVQGANIINGNLIGSNNRPVDNLGLGEIGFVRNGNGNGDFGAASSISARIQRPRKKLATQPISFHGMESDIEYEPSPNAPEVIYKPGHDKSYTAAASSQSGAYNHHSDTGVYNFNEDGYHYDRPQLAFTF